MRKVCTKCKIEKEANLDNFEWRNDNNCFRAICKLCRKLDKKNYYNKNKILLLENNKYYRNINSAKYKQTNKLWRDKNKHLIIENRQSYYKNNKKLICAKRKTYVEKNKEKVNASKLVWQKDKLSSDIIFLIHHNVRANITQIIKRNRGCKGGKSILNYLDYTLIDLRAHIENQFESWMNWSNWGIYNSKTWNDNDSSTWKWHIDHIIPQSDLPYDSMEHDNFKKCWALENLRPLNAKQNILDGASRIRHKKAA